MPYTSRDYRFTTARGAIYAICLVCPEDGRFCIRSFADHAGRTAVGMSPAPFHGIVRDVRILGYDGDISWHAGTEGLIVCAPGIRSDFPVVVRIR